ncbi:MAG: right-handed parallel beta-helix repeat-containing protein [Candidatus Hydrogenedentes bacterium]|nr:right-handed parallel beta-helix repeat-containing protein [Candidatus Hydrogenedentota bacterium]
MRFFVFTVLLGVSAMASATDYYVSPSGNDSNPGTSPEQAWKSLTPANAVSLAPGDRLLFEEEQTFSGTLKLDRQDSGTAEKRVVIASYGEGRATIDGGAGTAVLAEECDSIDIQNLIVKGAGRKNGNSGCGVHLLYSRGASISGVEAHGFRNSGVLVEGVRDARIEKVHAHDNGFAGIAVGNEQRWSEDVRIAHCIAENNPGDPENRDNHSGNGIVVGCVRNCTIEYCEAFNNGWDMPREGNGPVGIWAWNADRVVVQFCVSHDNKSPSWDGGGFDLDGGVTNSILQYNLSYNNVGPGYFMCMYWGAPVWKNNIIRYNISQNDGSREGQNAGIRVHWMEGMSDAEIYNNTVYNEIGAAVDFKGDQAPRMRFRNNIFVSKKTLITGGANKARFEGNLYWLLDGKPFEVDGHTSLEAWSNATGQEMLDGKLVGLWADPKLVRPGITTHTDPVTLAKLKEYLLESGSPCIGAGLIIEDNGARDFWGHPVPSADKPSLGAHQP